MPKFALQQGDDTFGGAKRKSWAKTNFLTKFTDKVYLKN